jgi:hypothetical protein
MRLFRSYPYHRALFRRDDPLMRLGRLTSPQSKHGKLCPNLSLLHLTRHKRPCRNGTWFHPLSCGRRQSLGTNLRGFHFPELHPSFDFFFIMITLSPCFGRFYNFCHALVCMAFRHGAAGSDMQISNCSTRYG